MLAQSVIEQYDALIFDMDGTLIDTMPSHAKAWEQVGQVLGYPIEPDAMYELSGSTTYIIAREIMKRANIPEHYFEQIVEMKRKFGLEMVLENATLLPAFDIIKANLGKKPMAIGTGSHRTMVNLLDKKFNLRHYVSVIIDSEDVKNHKPAPDTFLKCAEQLGIAPQHCLVFEDADLGVQAALNGGMDVFDVRTNQITKATR
ncbi:beta-phosphoglucomutase family hydrolase [Mannheimia sp. AT1]|uniref:Beta-phosphoglucomutase family hydrolase n=1 Tax=Mannheimia cairinae TaxID=3025936 RepID=A0ABT5MM01_9PAST|nr:beta-phosphoglucomutase family hydrolase [Mannheimia cairinae]MDD0823216.1 beta-phosphoglucomutase family hydrolase [Mannheimia cairinae]MDD0825758.1 beta-phosphoglucomutase family hydrolase [Mannheimia cairinae]